MADWETYINSFPSAGTLSAQNLSDGPHSTLHGNLGAAINAWLIDAQAAMGSYTTFARKLAAITSANVVNPTSATYGAVGDGSTDDTTAIQSALTALALIGGGVLVLPEGQYNVTGITVPSNVFIVGAGVGATTIHCTAALGTTVNFEGTYSALSSSSHCKNSGLRGVKITGTSTGVGINLEHASSLHLTDFRVDNVAYGIRAYGAWDSIIDGDWRVQECDYGLFYASHQNDAILSGVVDTNNIRHVGGTIESCYVTDITITGKGTDGTGTGSQKPNHITFDAIKVESSFVQDQPRIILESVHAVRFQTPLFAWTNYDTSFSTPVHGVTIDGDSMQVTFASPSCTNSTTNVIDAWFYLNGTDFCTITDPMFLLNAAPSTAHIEFAGTNDRVDYPLDGLKLGPSFTPANLTISGTPTSVRQTYVRADGQVSMTADLMLSDGSPAASEAYVDNAAAGLTWKDAVACATTANITLSGEQTIDGVTTSASRVLVKNQSTASQNGIYVSAAGAWSRATDMDAGSEFPGGTVLVSAGTTLANTAWTCTNSVAPTVGSTAITFAQFSGGNPPLGGDLTGTADSATVAKIGTTPVSGDGSRITATGLFAQSGTPTATTDLATKAYVDAAASAGVATDTVRYVDPVNGSDSNDGSSWASAKATVYAAVMALKTNSTTVPHKVGTVYVAPGQTVEHTLPIPITRNVAIIGAPSGGGQGITSSFDNYGTTIKAGDDTNADLFASDVFGTTTTLTADLTNSGTTITVASGTHMPTSSFVIRIGGELIEISSRSGNTLTASTRGYDFSTAVAHDTGETVEYIYDDWSHRVYLANLMIDGNRANNVGGGYGVKLRQAGFQTALDNVTIKECRKAGLYVAERAVNLHTYNVGITHCGSAQQGYTVSNSGGSILLTAPASGITTTTTEALDASETGVDVTSRSSFPYIAANTPKFVIQIDSERMLVTAGAGTGAGTFTVVRGYDGTTAATHSSGATVTLITPHGAKDGDYVFCRNFSGAVTNLAVDTGYYVASTPTTDTLTLATAIGGSAIAYSAGAGATLSLEFPFGELIEIESGANGTLNTRDGQQFDDNARAHVGILHRSASDNHKILISGFKSENKDGSQSSNDGISVYLKAVPGSDRFESYTSAAFTTAAAMNSGLTDGIVIQFANIGSTTGLNKWERYWIVNRTAGTASVTPGTFQVALTPGGTPVTFGGSDSEVVVQTMGGGATCVQDLFFIDQRSATGALGFVADSVTSQMDGAIATDATWTARTDHAIVHLYGASEAQADQTVVNLRGVSTASNGFDYLIKDGRNSVTIGDPEKPATVYYQGVPAAATALRQYFGQVMLFTGSGAPESVVTAPVGSLYLRTDGSTSTTLYVKTSGTGNTGWTGK